MLTVTGAVHEAMPEVLSEQVNVTVTLVLFHPAAFLAGVAAAVIVGRSVSVPVIVAVTVLPTPPRTVTAIVSDAVSVTALLTFGLVWLMMVLPLMVINGLALVEPVTTSVYAAAVLAMVKVEVTAEGVAEVCV